MKYSDQIAKWLTELGYTHCFFVGGGNIMHLVESLSRYLECVPVVHEVAASIAAEYFNESSSKKSKALALVTAGPGLTNSVTGIAGAFLESRELLVIGGQAKTVDLARGKVRQRGIQEIDGVSIVKAITKKAELMDNIWDAEKFKEFISNSSKGRPGPVFLEIPIDIQAKDVDSQDIPTSDSHHKPARICETQLYEIQQLLVESSRPVILLGGGVKRSTIKKLLPVLGSKGIPVATTWNGADRISSNHPLYIGRPNTWGQRSANICLQQADLLLAFGTRLGMQQTGFNWQEFLPVGKVVQFDIDPAEINKGHPEVDAGFAVDANTALEEVLKLKTNDTSDWLIHCKRIRETIPLIEEGVNKEYQGYASPHKIVELLSHLTSKEDVIVPCSSGGAFTTMMQVFEQKEGQIMVTNKGLASMGYGLSGAIGAAVANPDKRVVLVEGDGGFAQNIQEIGTAIINNLNIKIFIFDDSGYASIRMTQRSYFNGRYVGCDTITGLGLPKWEALFKAWGHKSISVGDEYENPLWKENFQKKGLQVFIVKVNPEQTYFPKIQSRVLSDGSMASNPLHYMTPELVKDVSKAIFKYIAGENYE